MKYLIDRCTESNTFSWGIVYAGIVIMIIIATI